MCTFVPLHVVTKVGNGSQMIKYSATNVICSMLSMRNDEQAKILARFFKTGKGEYGEGDCFLGIRVPQTRKIAKEWKDLPLDEIHHLLMNPWHEVRLCGLLILVEQFEHFCSKRILHEKEAVLKREAILDFYINHAGRVNNWDLVDLSAPKILGRWLSIQNSFDKNESNAIKEREVKERVLDSLANSSCLWEQRMSIVCTWTTSAAGDPSWCLRYAEKHLHHSHDLMHKAVGWMLREMGKRVGMELLRSFLLQHATNMPRTALRYAIEKMEKEERVFWMNLK